MSQQGHSRWRHVRSEVWRQGWDLHSRTEDGEQPGSAGMKGGAGEGVLGDALGASSWGTLCSKLRS